MFGEEILEGEASGDGDTDREAVGDGDTSCEGILKVRVKGFPVDLNNGPSGLANSSAV